MGDVLQFKIPAAVSSRGHTKPRRTTSSAPTALVAPQPEPSYCIHWEDAKGKLYYHNSAGDAADAMGVAMVWAAQHPDWRVTVMADDLVIWDSMNVSRLEHV